MDYGWEQVVDLLMKHNLHVTFAESCTGGLLAAQLVSVPNASKVFDMGFVTYATEAKRKYLDVKEETLRHCGVYSEQVAKEMAAGAAKAEHADVAVGISGVAGANVTNEADVNGSTSVCESETVEPPNDGCDTMESGASADVFEPPIGTVCFGFYVNGRITSSTQHFGDIGRNEVREAAVRFVVKSLCEKLNEI